MLTKEDMEWLTGMMSQMLDTKLEKLSVNLEEKLSKSLSESLEEKLSKSLEEKLTKTLEKKMDIKMEQLAVRLEERLDRKMDERFERFEDRFTIKMSNMIDVRLKAETESLKRHLKRIEVDLLENNIVPRLSHIESCYTSTYHRYEDYTDKMEVLMMDMDVVKKIIADDHALYHASQVSE